jgi:hypothetical protein
MATKTLVLRPISITSDDTSLVTFYPSDTTMDNAHILVNEEVADDDATYITGGLGSGINFHFSFTKPEDLKNITGFSFKVRNKFETSGSNHNVAYKIYIENNNYTLNSLTANSTVYTDMSESIVDDIRNAIISALDSNQNLNFYITQTSGTNSKSKPIRTTQMYIEITYESNDAVLQYFKQNNEWINIGELNIYYKKNNEWYSLNEVQLESYIDKKYLIEVM